MVAITHTIVALGAWLNLAAATISRLEAAHIPRTLEYVVKPKVVIISML